MRLKKYFYILLSLIYMDLIFNLFAYDNYLISSAINMFLFALVNASFICIFTSIFNERVNRIINYLVYIFLWIWYSLYCVIYRVFITPFSISLLEIGDQTLSFGSDIIRAIVKNIHIIFLFFVPVMLLIIFKKKIKFSKIQLKDALKYGYVFLLTTGIFIGNIFIQGKNTGSIYNLYYETNNVSLNIERLGVMSATYLDLKRMLFDFNEKIAVVKYEEADDEYIYNLEEISFNDSSHAIAKINKFIQSEIGTNKNKYTGIFEGKNLIFIVAESFSEIALSPEYTPTLYKLVHDGFYFKNFYTSNNVSTIGGEFQALTGLYADNTIIGAWRSGKNYYPYGMGTMFKNVGYNVYAYHDHDAYFQNRNVYLKTQGFDSFKACNTGLEELINCHQWPESDIDLMNATIDDYINSEKLFMTYYMTVSGHLHYDFSSNAIAKKNRELVQNLEYSEAAKAYLATQIELDKALAILMNRLEETGKLDDTVIVLLGDHYPYDLSLDDINSLSIYKRDQLIEANSNALIIYNSEMDRVDVEKVGMSIDVLPTVLNLFGMKYDSRLIMGKDILSNASGIAIFKDKSWITNRGTYYAATGKFIGEDVTEDYIQNINNIVNNRLAISRMIVDNNYYNYIFSK